MPTPIVPWFPESSCHITARGNRKSEIFRDKEDFKYYLMLMDEALKYFEEVKRIAISDDSFLEIFIPQGCLKPCYLSIPYN